MAERVRVGVVGCGLIAQVMHLPYLAELEDRFEIAALCDISEPVAAECARRYGVERTYTRWQDLVDAGGLDAVMILTSGSHAPVAVAAAQAGMHVFVEKPMCLSVAEGHEMLAAARAAGVQLMVGTMKRYDPAYERLAELLPEVVDLRLVRVTTLESPFEPYVAHYPLVKPSGVPEDIIAALRAEEDAILASVLGPDAAADDRDSYRFILLDNLVHELNALRGLLGEPERVLHADLSPRRASINLAFPDVEVHLSWVDLPGIARYSQEFAVYAPNDRLTLTLPSPFLRSAPSELVREGGEPGTAHSWRSVETVAYDEAFKRELIELSECIQTDRQPRTSGEDGLRDVALCTSILRAHRDRTTVERPTDVSMVTTPTEVQA
jgi:predicted dehydrogenase